MDFGNRLSQARQEKGFSRQQIGDEIGTSSQIIGRYERNEMSPSIEVATKFAQVLGVTLDYLVGLSSLAIKDKKMLERLENIEQLPQTQKTEILNVLDAYIRDWRARQAYLG